jgi:hypothetical protein
MTFEKIKNKNNHFNLSHTPHANLSHTPHVKTKHKPFKMIMRAGKFPTVQKIAEDQLDPLCKMAETEMAAVPQQLQMGASGNNTASCTSSDLLPTRERDH